MAQSLKFVVLGATGLEVKELLEAVAQSTKSSEVSHGEVAGSRVYRFSNKGSSDKEGRLDYTVYGASMESDFRAVFSLLLETADGAIGLIPADLTREDESRKVLVSLHRAMQARPPKEQQMPFVVQYHWALQATGPSPEELDQLLGVNPEVAPRIFSQAGGDQVGKGILALREFLKD